MTDGQDSLGKQISGSAKFWLRVAGVISIFVAASSLLATVADEGLFGRPFGPVLKEWLDGFASVTDEVFVPVAAFVVWIAGLIGFTIALGPMFKVLILVALPMVASFQRNGLPAATLVFGGVVLFASAVVVGLLPSGDEWSAAEQFFVIAGYIVALAVTSGLLSLLLSLLRHSNLGRVTALRALGIDLLMIVFLAGAAVALDWLGALDLVLDLVT